MQDRVMRLLIFFDLPVETSNDRRNYRKFHKLLIEEGFIMMQESMYSRMMLSKKSADFLLEKIKKKSPASGLIQAMIITEKQYANITYITGESPDLIADRFERLTII